MDGVGDGCTGGVGSEGHCVTHVMIHGLLPRHDTSVQKQNSTSVARERDRGGERERVY